jgi:hypothetical protein
VDDEDTQALHTDAYLDRLLTGARPSPVDDVPLDLAPTADALHRALVRYHPSFGFEERLAARLRAEAGGGRGPGLDAGRGLVIRFPTATGARPGALERRSRGLVVGGVIASGVIASGVSIAGAALIAWRRSRADVRMGRSA